MSTILTLIIAIYILSVIIKPKKSKITAATNTKQAYKSEMSYTDMPVRVTVSYQEPERASVDKTANVEWTGNEPFNFKGFHISNPLTYYAQKIDGNFEPSCIYQNLVVSAETGVSDISLGYYPSYKEMTPKQRAYYLRWMAEGRRAPLQEIGYAFVFFYGLERRALYDKKDRKEILYECIRLLEIYSESSSFNGYLSRFITYLLALDKNILDFDSSVSLLKKIHVKYGQEDALLLIMSYYYEKEIPLTPELAMLAAKMSPNTMRSIVFDRVHEEFVKLFSHKYQDTYPGGLVLKASKNNTSIGYFPASAALSHYGGFNCQNVSVPNVFGIPSQFKKSEAIFNECIEELKSLSRLVQKGIDIKDRAAYEALPARLRETSEHPDAAKWRNLISSKELNNFFIYTQVSELADLMGFENKEKYTRKQCEQIVSTAECLGYFIMPNVRITDRSYNSSEIVAVGRLAETIQTERIGRAKASSVILELAMHLAKADGRVDSSEVAFINRFIEKDLGLNNAELKIMEMYANVMLKEIPSFQITLKKLKETLSSTQLNKLTEFVLGLSAADGDISQPEIKLMYKMCKVFEIDSAVIDNVVSPKFETVQTTINRDKLAALISETKEVGHMLSEVFQEFETIAEEEDISDQHETVYDTKFDGLDIRYAAVLSELMKKDEWQTEEFQKLVREKGLMPSAVIEEINLWSDEHFEDYLIEESDVIEINRGLLGAAA